MTEQRNAERDREIIAAATAGPWDYFGGDGAYCIYDETYFNRHIAYIAADGVESKEREEANARFIAEAREAFPHWLERAVSAEKRVAELEKALAAIAESEDKWYVNMTPMQEYARKTLNGGKDID